MNQKITLRFADHVLTFEVPGEEVTEIRLAFRRRWPYKFVRANGDFYVHFDQVLWMKVSAERISDVTGSAQTDGSGDSTPLEDGECPLIFG